MSNQLTLFKDALDNYPKDASDFNVICSIAKAQYDVLNVIIDTLLIPQSVLKDALESGLSSLDSIKYDAIIHALDGLNTVLKTASPVIPTRIDPDIVRAANLLFTNCKDLLSVLPQDMFNLLEDYNHGINSFINLNNSLIMLPTSLANMISSSLLKLKDNTLKSILGSLFDDILFPVLDYENFLNDNGINEMIRKMSVIEKCMMNKNLCGRPRKDFLHDDDKMLNSTYYKKQFLINSQGQIELEVAGITTDQQTKFNNIMKSLRTYRSH
jgi:hypothetical protein